VRRAGKTCLIAMESRIPADWARNPWLAYFAFQAGHSCTAGMGEGFCRFVAMECKYGASCRKNRPDRKGIPHPCGLGSPSLARTLCFFRQAIPARLAWVRGFADLLQWSGSTVRRAGKACLLAKEFRIPADWARHPWLAHFAFSGRPFLHGWHECGGFDGLQACPRFPAPEILVSPCSGITHGTLVRKFNYIARFSGSGATSTFTPRASNALTCAALMPLSVIR